MNEQLPDFTTECLKLEQQIEAEYIDINELSKPIVDGIVNIELYQKAKFKILWILKEPYDDIEDDKPSGGGWHFCKHFLSTDDFLHRIGRSRKTWHPIIYTCFGILNDFMKFDEMSWIRNKPEMARIIRHIAVINVNKLPGFTRTYNYGNISSAYQEHNNILLKQIEVYNPDIIIGGSTLPLFYSDLQINSESLIKNGSLLYTIKANKLFIQAYHPAQTQIQQEQYVNDIINTTELWFNQLT